MGIDVYAKWDGQTDAEKKAQITGFSIVHGHTGYLREAYHGGPYATRVLFPECFSDDVDGAVPIPAATLRERLPLAINATAERYADDPYVGEAVNSVIKFVELYERLDAEGKNPRVHVSY